VIALAQISLDTWGWMGLVVVSLVVLPFIIWVSFWDDEDDE
jgi:hypothetical protein